MQAVVGCQKGVMVRGVPCVDRGNWELESHSLFVTRCLTKNVLARIECFHRHAIKIKIKSHSVDKVKKL